MDERALAVAATQLGLLVRQGVLSRRLEQTALRGGGTPIFDVNGEVLYERVPLDGVEAYADVAVDPRLGAPLVALTYGTWDPDLAVREAARALGRVAAKADETRIVAYSHPRLAVQFLSDGAEVAMVEIGTGRRIGEAGEPMATPPTELTRWSYLDSLSRAEARRRAGRYEQILASVAQADLRDSIVLSERPVYELARADSRVLRYSGRGADHECFELRGQETSVWCVGASVQMVLDFYRYQYTQDRLATELGLGTRTNPNGLSYSDDGEVVVALENLTGKALTANMNTSPTFAEIRAEIRANRPVISFVPEHSRTVAGYTQSRFATIGSLGFRGLLVYDPWPVETGAITRWENWDATTYRRTFTARVTLA